MAAVLGANIFSIISCRPDDRAAETTAADTTVSAADAAAETVQDEQEQTQEAEELGEGVGMNQARVVWSHNPESVDWDGKGYWWNINNLYLCLTV